MYIQPSTGKTFASHSAIRDYMQHALLPPTITDGDLAYLKIFPVAPTNPTVGPGQIAEPAKPKESGGVWRQEWTVRNATPEELVVEPEPIAEAIPMLNLLLVLIEDGHLDKVVAAITGMPGDDGKRARAYWDKAQTARRDNPLVNMLWPQLYADEAAFDDAWRRAASMQP